MTRICVLGVGVWVLLAGCGTTEPTTLSPRPHDGGAVEPPRKTDDAQPGPTTDAAADDDAADPVGDAAGDDAPVPAPPDAAGDDAAGDDAAGDDAPVPPAPDAAGDDAPLPADAASPDAAAPADAGTVDRQEPPPSDARVAAPDARPADRPDARTPDAALPDAPRCVTGAPTVIVTPGTSPAVLPNTATPFDVAITNHDSAACGPRTFDLDILAATFGMGVDPFPGRGQTSAPVMAGETTHMTITATPTDLLDGDRGTASFDVRFAGTPFFAGVVEVVVADPPGCHVSTARELMITNVSVVDDPVRTSFDGDVGEPARGAWTFARLVEAMAPTPADAPAMVEAMLGTFLAEQTINGFTVTPRFGMQGILESWPRTGGGALDLRAAPFRLLAIVNRFDLRDLDEGNAGEARFVFGFLAEGVPLQATIIFEYQLPASTEADVLDWAQSFHALGALPFSPAYNFALETLTERFTGRGANPGGTNGSAIRAVRTNDIAFGAPWELRQFGLSPATGMLVPVPVERIPDARFNGSDRLGRYVNANAAAIIAEQHTVPLVFEGAPFLAGSAPNDLLEWSAPGILDNEARHHFSLNTCTGCHGSETGTAFLMVHPRGVGSPSFLSRFMTGTTVTDPGTGLPRTLNDLGRRRDDLTAVVCPPDGAKRPAADLRKGIRRVH